MFPDPGPLASFDFYGKTLNGLQEQRSREKRAVSLVDNNLGTDNLYFIALKCNTDHLECTDETNKDK